MAFPNNVEEDPIVELYFLSDRRFSLPLILFWCFET